MNAPFMGEENEYAFKRCHIRCRLEGDSVDMIEQSLRVFLRSLYIIHQRWRAVEVISAR